VTNSVVEYNIQTAETFALGDTSKPPTGDVLIRFVGTKFSHSVDGMEGKHGSVALIKKQMPSACLSGEYPVPEVIISANGNEWTWEVVLGIAKEMGEFIAFDLKRISNNSLYRFAKSMVQWQMEAKSAIKGA